MTDTIAPLSLGDRRSASESDEQGRPTAETVLKKKKRVFIYGINYAPEPIGVGRFTGEIGAFLVKEGLTIEVVTAPPHYPGWKIAPPYRNRFSREHQGSVRIIRCPLLLKGDSGGIWRLLAPLSFAILSAPVAIARILALRPDIVFCVEPTLLSAPAALLAAKLIGARTVLHIQDLEVDAAFAVGHLRKGMLERVAAAFERVVLGGFDAVVTISNRMRDRLEAKGVPSVRLSVVRNWVDLEKIKPRLEQSEIRQEFDLPKDKFIALYAGNIGLKQALPLLLETAKILNHEPNLIFVIAGEGPEKEKLIDRYGHLDNVRFLPLQPEEKLCDLLNMADVHVLPQHRLAADLVLPSKLGGMLASGKPCIVMADIGTELYEFLFGAAILTPAGDVTALANAVRNAMAGDAAGGQELRLRLAQKLRADLNLDVLARTIQNADSLLPHS
ncbi:MAG: WcaI family glycosyltransferase [Pseudolabrys sp.]|nr:WcaI family glycosyltransferase [Pseudolabrys sp.]